MAISSFTAVCVIGFEQRHHTDQNETARFHLIKTLPGKISVSVDVILSLALLVIGILGACGILPNATVAVYGGLPTAYGVFIGFGAGNLLFTSFATRFM